MKEKQRLYLKSIELRATETEGKQFVSGTIPYNSKSVPLGWSGFTEIIDRTAFDKTLADKAEVRALFNHDDSRILGNTRSGTLTLESTDEGLTCSCELPDTSYAHDLYEVVSRGDVTTMSFGFIPVKVEKQEKNTRVLKEVKLEEVSFGVPCPAYPETNSAAYTRSLMKRKIDVDIDVLTDILSKEELTPDDAKVIEKMIADLGSLLPAKEPEKEAAPEGDAREEEPPATPPEEGASGKEEALIELIDTIIETSLEMEEELEESVA
jgi:HK97 family phage prohead protease